MEWLKKIIVSHLKDLNQVAPSDDVDIEYRADKMILDIEKALSARKDFKEEK